MIAIIGLISLESTAQDKVPFLSNDSLYREDQFYIDFTYNFIASVPNGVKVRGFSGGVHGGYLRDMPINIKRSVAVAVGLGLGYDQYGQNLFIGEKPTGESIYTVLDENYNFDRNRLSMSMVEIPVEFRWRSSTPQTYKFWRVYAGLRAGYVYYYKSTFKQPGNTVYQTKLPEFDPLRLSATLCFGYNTFNFYGSYSINPYFKNATTTSGEKLDFRSIQVGLIFYLL